MTAPDPQPTVPFPADPSSPDSAGAADPYAVPQHQESPPRSLFAAALHFAIATALAVVTGIISVMIALLLLLGLSWSGKPLSFGMRIIIRAVGALAMILPAVAVFRLYLRNINSSSDRSST